MKIVLSWLREFCAAELSAEGLGELLASKGAHPEGIERPWERLMGVIVARVVEILDHPGSETLCVARVQTGSGEQEVVVGVRNMRVGDLVPLAPPGATVPGLPEPLGARTIRGVESNGMLCSSRELGISPDHAGILVLDDDGLEPGDDIVSALGLDDSVLDLEIEANRPDTLSVIGIAREVSAATGVPLIFPEVAVDESDEPAEGAAAVEVLNADACPRYLARIVRGVSWGPAPLRIQARLTAAGVRPVANVVDATNYVMLELGQPLHGFDLDRLAGPGIVVRRAVDGERLTTLDDVDRQLESSDLLICDLETPVALAGVIGGAASEVSAETKDVLLESAYFEPRGILRTSRRLGLLSEAALRFSRGTDPENVGPSAARAARLVAAWSGGTVLGGVIDVGGTPPRRRVSIRSGRASLVAGHPISTRDIEEGLAPLGFPTTVVDETVEAEVPSWRPDVTLEVDLIEEVIRSHGYEGVGSTVPAIRQPGSLSETFALRRRMRELLVRAGSREALSLSFASQADVELLDEPAVRVANPPSAEEPFLRTSLLPNLLKALTRNMDRGVRSVTLFEVGHVFRLAGSVDERESVAAVLWGSTGQRLHGEDRIHDVLDAKGTLEVLLDGLGVSWRLGDALSRPFHPARSARILVSGTPVGVLGELHPADARRFGAEPRVALFELDVSALQPHVGAIAGLRDVPRFPPVRRDLAFVVSEDASAGTVTAALKEAAGELLGGSLLFDVFRGGSLPEGTKSLAFSLDIRAPDRTLTDRDADEVVDRIVARLGSDFGATLRA